MKTPPYGRMRARFPASELRYHRSNIELLCEYLSQSEFLIGGEKRRIAIAEFGVNGNPEDDDSLANQAASFAYGYCKAAAQDMIESVIYYRQVDSLAEEGVYFGLWETGTDDSADMTEKKPIYDVFKYIDTPRSTEFSTSYISRLGAAGWDAVVPGFYVEQFGTRELFEGTAVETDASRTRLPVFRSSTSIPARCTASARPRALRRLIYARHRALSTTREMSCARARCMPHSPHGAERICRCQSLFSERTDA